MPSERDPRVDPRPGDVLEKKYQGQYFESRGYIERQVFEVDGKRVTYVGPDVCSPTITLKSWRQWARKSKVLTKGADDAE